MCYKRRRMVANTTKKNKPVITKEDEKESVVLNHLIKQGVATEVIKETVGKIEKETTVGNKLLSDHLQNPNLHKCVDNCKDIDAGFEKIRKLEKRNKILIGCVIFLIIKSAILSGVLYVILKHKDLEHIKVFIGIIEYLKHFKVLWN